VAHLLNLVDETKISLINETEQSSPPPFKLAKASWRKFGLTR
jgi:hypothetical protein